MLSFNGINTSQIQIIGGVNIAATNPNVIITDENSTAGTTTLGTVPAGKIWTILNMSISNKADLNTSSTCELKAGALSLFISTTNCAVAQFAPIVSTYTATYATGIRLAAGTALTITTTTNSRNVGTNIYIYEETA